MAKEIKLTAPATLIFKNPYEEKVIEDTLWNTGLASLDEAHCDEAGNAGKVTITGEIGPKFMKKHVASIRLYKNNEYVYLNPGDTLSLAVDNMNALGYYLNIPDTDLLKLTNRASFEVIAVEAAKVTEEEAAE